MNPTGPRYATLRDYLRVVRRYRVMILLVTIACAGAAFVLTERQKATYQASAQVFFQDETQELNLLGTAVFPALSDAVRAEIDAQIITSAPVVEIVRRDLGYTLPASALAASVSPFVNSQTDVVSIEATSGQPVLAQRIANAFASAAKTVAANQARAQFATVVTTVKAQFEPLIKSAPDPVTRAAYTDRIATLEVLATSADPAQIVQAAGLPTTPAGPRTVRNTILGVLLGLILGLLAAFARDALDRRLRGSSEIGAQLGWPIVGHIRAAAFGHPVFAQTNGKSPIEETDRDAFRMLRQNIRFLEADHPPKSIAVTSALPEEGKSTVAAALACASAIAGATTLLVECDLRRPSLSERLGIDREPGLTDYLLGEATPAEIVRLVDLPSPAVTPSTNANGNGNGNHADVHRPDARARRLACIPAGRRVPETAELLGSERFRSFLKDVTEAYEQVVLDSSPLLLVADTSILLTETDATLICVRSGRTTLEHAAALRQALERLPHRSIGVVVTGVKPEVEYDLGYYAYAYKPIA